MRCRRPSMVPVLCGLPRQRGHGHIGNAESANYHLREHHQHPRVAGSQLSLSVGWFASLGHPTPCPLPSLRAHARIADLGPARTASAPPETTRFAVACDHSIQPRCPLDPEGRQTPVTDDGNHIDPGRSSASQMGTGECCVCEGAGMVGVVATRRSVATSCKIHSRNAWTSGLRRAAAVAIR